MSPHLQTLAALLLVAAAAAWLFLRGRVKKKNPGCGGDCGCPTNDLKPRLKR
jgi:FeoB-associated Cys-rich membrane protein